MFVKLALSINLLFSSFITNIRNQDNLDNFLLSSEYKIIDNETGDNLTNEFVEMMESTGENIDNDYIFTILEDMDASIMIKNNLNLYSLDANSSETWTIYHSVRVPVLGNSTYRVVLKASVRYNVYNNKITAIDYPGIFLDEFSTYSSSNLHFTLINGYLIQYSGLNTSTVTLRWGYDIIACVIPEDAIDSSIYVPDQYMVYSTRSYTTRLYA